MHSDARIRTAEPEDVEVIAELNLAMAWETEHVRLSEDTLTRGIEAVLANPRHGFYVVAEADGQVVGCLLITFEWSDWRCGLFWWIRRQNRWAEPTLPLTPFRRSLLSTCMGQGDSGRVCSAHHLDFRHFQRPGLASHVPPAGWERLPSPARRGR